MSLGLGQGEMCGRALLAPKLAVTRGVWRQRFHMNSQFPDNLAQCEEEVESAGVP